MVFIDGTVVNVALPALQQHLNVSVYDVQWVVEALRFSSPRCFWPAVRSAIGSGVSVSI